MSGEINSKKGKTYTDFSQTTFLNSTTLKREQHFSSSIALLSRGQVKAEVIATSESGGYSEQAYHGRFTESSIHRLKQFGKVISNTTITNIDFQEVIEADGENVFLFLDPPYYSATKSALYGKNGNLHKGFDHGRFAETIKKCNHNWLITYDDSEYIRELFSFANIISWDLTYGMRNVTNTSDQIGKELFISN